MTFPRHSIVYCWQAAWRPHSPPPTSTMCGQSRSVPAPTDTSTTSPSVWRTPSTQCRLCQPVCPLTSLLSRDAIKFELDRNKQVVTSLLSDISYQSADNLVDGLTKYQEENYNYYKWTMKTTNTVDITLTILEATKPVRSSPVTEATFVPPTSSTADPRGVRTPSGSGR